MRFIITFSTIYSECSLTPKHVVKTKIYLACDEKLGVEPTISRIERACASPRVSPRASVVSFFSADTESDDESDWTAADFISESGSEAESFEMVDASGEATVEEKNCTTNEASSEDELESAAESDEDEETLDHCDEEDCTPLGRYGSFRMNGKCAHCDPDADCGVLDESGSIVEVINTREDYVAGLIVALTT